jgi:lysozyme family protein
MSWQQAFKWASPAVVAVIAGVFAIEGGYVNHPSDPGGATNHGVTEAVARQHGYAGDMKALPQALAASIYFADYIERPGFVPVIETSIPIGTEMVDSGVNAGPAQPSRWLQTALNALNRRGRDYANVRVDGKVGPATIAAYRSLARRRGEAEACTMVLRLLDAQQAVHYLHLASNDSAYEDFMPGWVLHRIGNVDVATCRS